MNSDWHSRARAIRAMSIPREKLLNGVKRLFLLCSVLALLLGMAGPLASTAFAQSPSGPHALVINIDGVINPSRSGLSRGLWTRLRNRGSPAHHRLDTPGAADLHQRKSLTVAGVSCATGRLRLPKRGPGRFSRHFPDGGSEFRRNGAGLKHRRGHSGLRFRTGPRRDLGQQGGKRRGGPHTQYRARNAGATPNCWRTQSARRLLQLPESR